MKILKVFMFMLLVATSFAQPTTVLTDFNGTYNVAVGNQIGTTNDYQVIGSFNHTQGQYSSSQVQVGDALFMLFNDQCVYLKVKSINSNGGSIIDAVVEDVEGILGGAFPAGKGALMRETPNEFYALRVDGVSNDLNACIRTHFTKQVDLSVSTANTDDQSVQTFEVVNNSLNILVEDDASGMKSVDLSPYMDNTDNQALTLAGDVLSLTDGGTVSLAAYMDNTDSQTLAFDGSTLTIAGGNAVDLSSLAGTDDQALTINTVVSGSAGNQVYNHTWNLENGGSGSFGSTDTDEQELSFVNDVLSIENGTNTVDLSQYTNTDNQTLALTTTGSSGGPGISTVNHNVAISDGNNVTVSFTDTDNQDLAFDATTNQLSISDGAAADLSDLDDLDNFTIQGDSGTAFSVDTDGQLISITGDGTTIATEAIGNTIEVSYIGPADGDGSSTNEFQDLTFSGNVIGMTNSTVTHDLSAYLDNTDDQALTVSGGSTGVVAGETSYSFSVAVEDGGTGTIAFTDSDNQALTFANDILSLEDGGTVDLSGYNSSDDQALTLAENVLSLEDGGQVNLAQYLDNTDTQNLGITNTGTIFTVTLDDGGQVVFDVADQDNDPMNELQTTTQTGSTVTLSQGGGTFSVDDADSIVGNEYITGFTTDAAGNITITDAGAPWTIVNSAIDNQALTFDGTSLSIEDGNSVNLSALLGTDAQTLSVTGTDLAITNGNAVSLAAFDESVTVTDGQGVDLTVVQTGEVFDVAAEVVISPDVDNYAELRTNGLFVPGFAFQTYDADATAGTAMIKATGPGVTYAVSNGVGTVTVPTGVDVLDISINGESSQYDGNGDFTIVIDQTIPYNVGYDSYIAPQFDVINTSTVDFGGPSESFAFVYDEGSTPQRKLVSINNGDITLKATNISQFSKVTYRISL